MIPKKKKPNCVADFRSINLCNVLYKLASKVLVNRLKLILPDIISENQSAFTSGRLINDNVLVAFEVFHAMHNNHNSSGSSEIRYEYSVYMIG